MSQQLTTSSLTEKQRAFIEAMIRCGDHVQAAKVAGYAYDSAGRDLVRNPAVQRAIAAGVASKILTEGAPIAYALLAKIIEEEAAPARVRVDAAKTILDRAGFIAPKAAEPATMGRAVADMSKDELRAFIAIAEHKLSTEAVDVTPAAEAEDEQR